MSQVEPVERNEWLQHAALFRDYNYRQCWDYGEMLAKRRGASSNHVRFMNGGEVIGLAEVRIKRAPLLGGIAYVSGGPLVRQGDGRDLDRLDACLKALRREYMESKGFVLRIQGTLGDGEWTRGATECFLSHGFQLASAGREYRTLLVDLGRPLAEIRSTLAQKWRNCLNKAERINPEVRVSTGVDDFDRFAVLFRRFVERKGFTVDLGATFFRQLQERLPTGDAMVLSMIESKGELVAGHLSTTLGDTCVYLLGATSDDALKSNAAYLLQWNVIKMAQSRGVRWYDLGGIDPQENPGVYHFKCGLGGVEARAPGPFELVPKAIGARLILHAERTFGRLRRGGKARGETGSKPDSPQVSKSPTKVAT